MAALIPPTGRTQLQGWEGRFSTTAPSCDWIEALEWAFVPGIQSLDPELQDGHLDHRLTPMQGLWVPLPYAGTLVQPQMGGEMQACPRCEMGSCRGCAGQCRSRWFVCLMAESIFRLWENCRWGNAVLEAEISCSYPVQSWVQAASSFSMMFTSLMHSKG